MGSHYRHGKSQVGILSEVPTPAEGRAVREALGMEYPTPEIAMFLGSLLQVELSQTDVRGKG